MISKILIILISYLFLVNTLYNGQEIKNHNFIKHKTKNGIYPEQERVIVIGDLHADFNKTKEIFINLNLIDENENWIGENTHVVQLGDQLDGKRHLHFQASGELNIIDFLERLNTQANKVGGAIHSLIGNHEIMNLLGDFRYASDEDILIQGKMGSRKEIFKPGGQIFGILAGHRHAILKIGNLVFSHAGILPSIIDKELSSDQFIEKMNYLMKQLLNGNKGFDNTMIKYFFDTHSILFNRILGEPYVDKKIVEESLHRLEANHMFIGHTIQEEINSLHDNSLWRLDVGISDSFPSMNNIQVLEVLGNGKQFNVINI